MKRRSLRLYFLTILASLPLIFLICFYLATDPFKVLYHYSSYYKSNVVEIAINRDYASTEIFLKNYDRYKYDSFIFGSSRSLAFTCSDITKYDKGNWFHFDASCETSFGVCGKLRLLITKELESCIV